MEKKKRDQGGEDKGKNGQEKKKENDMTEDEEMHSRKRENPYG